MTHDREAQIRDLFPLVKKIARRVHRLIPGSDVDDLVGEGSLGLIRAVDSFDASRGTSLAHYAARLISGAMLNGLRKIDPVSERVRREVREADRERYALATQLGEMPTQQQMEERRPALRRAVMHAHRYTPLSLDEKLPMGERVSVDWEADPGAIAAASDERACVRAALHRLSPRQRHVVALHYFRGKSLHQIGEALAISPQRASQLHQAAMKNLRKVLHGAH
ncbi:MAG TPA: sigma-70 family RNA polymerase sigma factor [Candidatus Baltobacteraceae bacterium]|nr:sigma-70 family RNA polymerase sigma factor [Candidatus Baltobacteraceae bacterium]